MRALGGLLAAALTLCGLVHTAQAQTIPDIDGRGNVRVSKRLAIKLGAVPYTVSGSVIVDYRRRTTKVWYSVNWDTSKLNRATSLAVKLSVQDSGGSWYPMTEGTIRGGSPYPGHPFGEMPSKILHFRRKIRRVSLRVVPDGLVGAGTDTASVHQYGSVSEAANDAQPDEECGDGEINQPNEQCDDGNLLDGDGCEADCTLPFCGNGIVDSTETCDGSCAPIDGKAAVCLDCQCQAVSACDAVCCDGTVVTGRLNAPSPESCQWLADHEWNPCRDHGGWSQLSFDHQPAFTTAACTGQCWLDCYQQGATYYGTTLRGRDANACRADQFCGVHGTSQKNVFFQADGQAAASCACGISTGCPGPC